MLDTNVAIHLRDRDAAVARKRAALEDGAVISIVTRVELEGGVYGDPAQSAVRRARLNVLLEALPTVPFDEAAAEVYKGTLPVAGYSRRKVLDQMIAVQAIVVRATLVIMNAADFADIPGIKVLAW